MGTENEKKPEPMTDGRLRDLRQISLMNQFHMNGPVVARVTDMLVEALDEVERLRPLESSAARAEAEVVRLRGALEKVAVGSYSREEYPDSPRAWVTRYDCRRCGAYAETLEEMEQKHNVACITRLAREALSPAPEPAAQEKCPRCDSPSPERHPAMQHEGEVQLCSHPWHASTEAGRMALEAAEPKPAAQEITACAKCLAYGHKAENPCLGCVEKAKEPAAQEAKGEHRHVRQVLHDGENPSVEVEHTDAAHCEDDACPDATGPKVAVVTVEPCSRCGHSGRDHGTGQFLGEKCKVPGRYAPCPCAGFALSVTQCGVCNDTGIICQATKKPCPRGCAAPSTPPPPQALGEAIKLFDLECPPHFADCDTLKNERRTCSCERDRVRDLLSHAAAEHAALAEENKRLREQNNRLGAQPATAAMERDAIRAEVERLKAEIGAPPPGSHPDEVEQLRKALSAALSRAEQAEKGRDEALHAKHMATLGRSEREEQAQARVRELEDQLAARPPETTTPNLRATLTASVISDAKVVADAAANLRLALDRLERVAGGEVK